MTTITSDYQDYLHAAQNSHIAKLLHRNGDHKVNYSQRVEQIDNRRSKKPRIRDIVVTDRHFYVFRTNDNLIKRYELHLVHLVLLSFEESTFCLQLVSSRSPIFRSKFNKEIVDAVHKSFEELVEGRTLEVHISEESGQSRSEIVNIVDDNIGVGDEDEEEFKEQSDDEAAISAMMKSTTDGFLLSNIVENEFVTGTLRTVLQRGRRAQFSNILHEYIVRQDRQIKRLCSRHYEEFLNAVEALKRAREDARFLSKSIAVMRDGVISAGGDLCLSVEKTQRHRFVAQNVESALVALGKCQALAALCARVEALLEERKYPPVLDTLEQIEHELRSSPRYAYSRFLQNRIPLLREKLRIMLRQEFNDCIREDGVKVGEHVIDKLKKKLDNVKKRREWRLRGHQRQISMSPSATSPNGTTSRPPLARGLTSATLAASNALTGPVNQAQNIDFLEDDEEDESLFEKLEIDFSPLYTCLHVYRNLGESNEFRAYYTLNRRMQVDLDMQPPSDASVFLSTSATYFAKIAGFFLIEDAILKGTSSLVSPAEMDALWDEGIAKMKVVLDEKFSYYTDPSDCMTFRNHLVHFCLSLQAYGFHVAPLLEFVQSLHPKFEEVLDQHIMQATKESQKNDKYESMRVVNMQQYRDFVRYGLIPEEPTVIFPIPVPFSVSIPETANHVLEGIDMFLAFAENIYECDEQVKKFADEILRSVGRNLEEVLEESPPSNVSQSAQIVVNCVALNTMCDFVESYIREKLNRPGVSTSSKFLAARTTFSQTKTGAEDIVFKNVFDKIGSFFTLSNSVNWCPGGKPVEANGHVVDLVSFIQTTFVILEMLPQQVLTDLEIKCCKFIAESLTTLIKGSEMKAINKNGILLLNLDVSKVIALTKVLPPECEQSFIPLREVLDIVMGDGFDSMPEEELKRSRLAETSSSSASYELLVALVEKLRSHAPEGKSKFRMLGAIMKKKKRK